MHLIALREALQQGGSKALQQLGANGNVDSIVIITILLLLVLCFLFDLTNEGPIIATMICQIVVFTFSRSAIAWWADNHKSGRWSSWLAWRNIGAVFHLTLLLSQSPWAESIAPFVLKRLRDSTVIFPMTCLMVGFMCGVEPGTLKAKARAAGLIVTLIAMRLLVLARALGGAAHSRSGSSSGELRRWGRAAAATVAPALYSHGAYTADQRELLAGGVRTLLCAPLLGAAIGMAVRAKLEQQSIEISRLQEHARHLEAARHEALMAPLRLSSSSSTSGSRHHPSSRDAGRADPTPPPQPLPPHRPPPQSECTHISGGTGGGGISGRSSVSAGSGRGQQRRVGGSCYGGSSGGGSGGGSTYGTDSEIGDFYARDDHEREQPLASPARVMTPLTVAEERPYSSAQRRETALWQTLADIGITPHDRGLSRDDATSHVSSARSSVPPEHPHVEYEGLVRFWNAEYGCRQRSTAGT